MSGCYSAAAKLATADDILLLRLVFLRYNILGQTYTGWFCSIINIGTLPNSNILIAVNKLDIIYWRYVGLLWKVAGLNPMLPMLPFNCMSFKGEPVNPASVGYDKMTERDSSSGHYQWEFQEREPELPYI